MRRLHLPDSAAPMEGERRIAPSARRNLEPIAAVLAQVLPQTGRALELASGTGQHIAAFGERFPGIDWQPTDGNPDNLPSIRAWTAGIANVAAPMVLDACAPGWGQGDRTSVHLTNLLHLISDTEADCLLVEAARALAPGGVFCLYGPFRRDGALLTDGDRSFDASLRAQDSAIGYKDIAWVTGRLIGAGLEVDRLVEMPAGNLMLVTRRPSTP